MAWDATAHAPVVTEDRDRDGLFEADEAERVTLRFGTCTASSVFSATLALESLRRVR